LTFIAFMDFFVAAAAFAAFLAIFAQKIKRGDLKNAIVNEEVLEQYMYMQYKQILVKA
jgi:hypothetical protein